MSDTLAQENIQFDARQSFRLLHWRDNLREVESILSPTQSVRVTGVGDRWHHHPEMELTIIQSGSGTRFVGDHIGPFQALDVVLIGSNVPHYWRGMKKSTGYALQFRFESSHPIWQLPEAGALQQLRTLSAHGLHISGQTAEQTLDLIKRIATSHSLERLGLFLQLLHLLSHCPASNRQRLSKRPFDLASVQIHQPSIERVIRHVLKHYRDPIALSDVLHIAGMSRATFARLFPKHAGKTFSTFLTQVRLEAVCQQLVQSDDTIAAIAFANGFNNLSAFNRMFQKLQHCSPKTYRKRHQQH